MSEEREAHHGRTAAEGANQDNPTDPELDVEGPNESAPGREPADADEETGDGGAPETPADRPPPSSS
jgi:hypothetical protein